MREVVMIDGDDRELLARTLDAVVRAAADVGTDVGIEGGLEGGLDGGLEGGLDAGLVDVGWHDALAVDAGTAVSLLFERQGRAGARSSALDAVLRHALGDDPSSGVVVVLPLVGSTEAPARPAGVRFDVAGLASSTVELDEAVLCVAEVDGAHASVTIPTDALELRPIAGLDPRLGLVEVTGSSVEGAPSPAAVPWVDAVAAGQRALAHELVGASRAMLQLARDHAIERIQFGRPIARFQAVRHRLADAYVAAEAAEAAADAAWEEGTPLAAAVANAVAGRSARLVAKHAQQVLAGIGFTAEHDLHHHVRRALVLDGLLGDARSLTRSTGEELLRTRTLPPMLPL